jgi:hypothetical protein
LFTLNLWPNVSTKLASSHWPSGQIQLKNVKSALKKLANKEVNVIFSVDLFNEGVDVPSVDTLFMLRPQKAPPSSYNNWGEASENTHQIYLHSFRLCWQAAPRL